MKFGCFFTPDFLICEIWAKLFRRTGLLSVHLSLYCRLVSDMFCFSASCKLHCMSIFAHAFMQFSFPAYFLKWCIVKPLCNRIIFLRTTGLIWPLWSPGTVIYSISFLRNPCQGHSIIHPWGQCVNCFVLFCFCWSIGPWPLRNLNGKFKWNFRHVIFKQILVINGWGISCEIALIWMSLDFTDDQSTLVPVMAWCCQATSHNLSQYWPRSLLPYGVTRLQWVNVYVVHVPCYRVTRRFYHNINLAVLFYAIIWLYA